LYFPQILQKHKTDVLASEAQQKIDDEAAGIIRPGEEEPPPPTAMNAPKNINSSWEIHDGGCHHLLELVKNPVLKFHGGRISL
jgi:hypothetical protein